MVARADKVTDPAIIRSLVFARRAQAYFSRRLNELPDEELYTVPPGGGRTRAHTVAAVGYQARALARLVTWAESGEIHPMHASRRAYEREIRMGATQAPRALRHLSDHAAIELDVAWRDLPEHLWRFEVVDLAGNDIDIAETVWMRIRQLWRGSLDLRNGGRHRDIPAEVRDHLESTRDDLVADDGALEEAA